MNLRFASLALLGALSASPPFIGPTPDPSIKSSTIVRKDICSMRSSPDLPLQRTPCITNL